MKRITNLLLFVAFVAALNACKPSDEKIGTAVNEAIAANASLSPVSATVKDGILTLSGEVETDELKALAENTLKAVKGVKSIVNNVTVKPKGPTAEELAQMADNALLSKVNEAFATYKVTGIVAVVKDGIVTLTGDVKRKELQNVMKAAMETGAVKVENQMNILK
jgi:hyperosmotically inducible periplasmic protein